MSGLALVLCTVTPLVHAKYVLHIVADDLGYDDVGWRNGHAITPTLDSLVKVSLLRLSDDVFTLAPS